MKFIVASVIEFLIILNAVIKVNCQICSTNWKLFGETYYLEVSTAKTFQDAKENCQLIGAELAMPKTTAQNVFLKSLACRPPLGLHRYWIGMTDLSKENAFKWEDGTFLDWGNERWAPGEPNNRWEQDCVAFIIAQDGDTNGKWSTERCSSNLLSLCSKRLVLPKLSQSPTVQNIRTTSFQLRWRCWTNVEDQGDGPVLGYNIDLTVAQYPTDADWRTVGFVLGGDHCEFSVEHLQIKTKYYVAVSILHGDSRHEGPRGPMLRVNTHDVELPVLLDPPEVIDVGRSFVMITWTRWTGKVGEGYGPIAGYNVNIKNGAIWKTLVTLAAVAVDLEFNVTGLEPDTPYQFMVTVIYQDGRAGPPGQILCVFTEPNELCTEPDTASFSSGDNTTQWVLTTKNPDCIHPRTHQCTTWKILFCLLVLLCVGVGAMISIQRCRRSKTSSASRQDPEDREDHHEQCENRHTYPHVSTSSNSRYIDNDFQTSRTTLNYSSGYVRSLNRGGCIKQDM